MDLKRRPGMGQSLVGMQQNGGTNYQMLVGQSNNSIGGQPTSSILPLQIHEPQQPQQSIPTHHGHQNSTHLTSSGTGIDPNQLQYTAPPNKQILSINSPIVGVLNAHNTGESFSSHYQKERSSQPSTFSNVMPFPGQQQIQQTMKAGSSLGTVGNQSQSLTTQPAPNTLYLVQTPQGQQAIALHPAQIGNRTNLLVANAQGFPVQPQQQGQQPGSQATTASSTQQASTQSVNGQNLVQGQQNQAALRFQLNSKRYSNMKETQQPSQQQTQNPPSRESVLRHRLSKKQGQDMQYLYHLQPKYQTNQGTPAQQQNFSKTMNNFASNTAGVTTGFNLNGQKMMLQSNQQSQGMLHKDYEQLSNQGGPSSQQSRPSGMVNEVPQFQLQYEPNLIQNPQYNMTQKSELSVGDTNSVTGSNSKRQALQLRNVSQGIAGLNGQQFQQRTTQSFHTPQERPQSQSNRMPSQQSMQAQNQQIMQALYLQNAGQMLPQQVMPQQHQLQTPQQETKLKMLFHQQPTSSSRQSHSQAPSQKTMQVMPTSSVPQTQKLISMKHMHLQQIRMNASSGQQSAGAIQSIMAPDSAGQVRDNSSGGRLTGNQQVPIIQPQQLIVPTQGQQKQINMIRQSTQQNQIKFIKNQLCQISKLMQDEDGNEHEQISQPGDDWAAQQANMHSFTQQKLRNASPGIVFASTNKYQDSPEAVKSSLLQNHKDFGMTLEDDVESMLSDQFNTSNESMFKVRLHSSNVNQFGGGLGAGDSTYRCNESVQDDDRGMISESEDGWYNDKDPKAAAANQERQDDFEDISEHSSDERTDSSGGLEDPQGVIVGKKKKKKGEKGESKKKKKKKNAGNEEPEPNLDKDIKKQAQKVKVDDEPAKKLIDQYKKLQEDTKEKKEHRDNRGHTKQENTKDNKKVEKDSKTAKKPTAVNEQTKIKIAIQPTKGGKNENVKNPGDQKIQRNDDKKKENNNTFNSPAVKKLEMKKMQSEKLSVKTNENLTSNKKEAAVNKTEKKEEPKQSGAAGEKKGDLNVEKQASNNVAQTPLKKPKKNGFKLQALNHALPKNLQECYDRFFETDYKINPQFEYENAQSALKFLEQFTEPDGNYLEFAKKILDSFLKEYGSESHYLDCEGKKLDQDETHQSITDYLQVLGIEEWISINFQKNQVAPTSVTHDPKTGKCKMNIKLPCEYREGRMMGVLDHEIGTHFLRKHNEKLQQWYKKRDKFEMKTCIATEEGLACTNQMVQTVKDGKCKPFLYRSALNYYSAYMAKELSFVDLFKDLEKYVDSPQARWKFTLRVKRGLTDTSQKGGLYKDQVYLEGAVKILQRRKQLNFKALLCGKLSLDDYDRESIYSILNYEGQLLPKFMDDMEEYAKCLDVIGETNHIQAEGADEVQLEEPEVVEEVVKPISAGEQSIDPQNQEEKQEIESQPDEKQIELTPPPNTDQKENQQWSLQVGEQPPEHILPKSPSSCMVTNPDAASQFQLAQSAGQQVEVNVAQEEELPLQVNQQLEPSISQFPQLNPAEAPPLIIPPQAIQQIQSMASQDPRVIEYMQHRFDGGGDQFQLPNYLMTSGMAIESQPSSIKISPRPPSEFNQLPSVNLMTQVNPGLGSSLQVPGTNMVPLTSGSETLKERESTAD